MYKSQCRKVDPYDIYIYIYAFSRRFYPKRLTVHSGYTFFLYVCSLGIEPTTFAVLMQYTTTEPQEHRVPVTLMFCGPRSHMFYINPNYYLFYY